VIVAATDRRNPLSLRRTIWLAESLGEGDVGTPPIRIEKYHGETQEAALRKFAEDAARAASAGYEATAQSWDGTALLVTYRFVGVAGRGASGTPEPTSTELLLPAGAVAAGGALIAAGSVLPWVTATGAFGISISRSGVEGGDGLITIGLGIGIGLLGLSMVRGRNLSRWKLAFVASVVTLILIAIDYSVIQGRIDDLADDSIFATIGLGVWVVGIGAVIASLASWRLRSEERAYVQKHGATVITMSAAASALAAASFPIGGQSSDTSAWQAQQARLARLRHLQDTVLPPGWVVVEPVFDTAAERWEVRAYDPKEKPRGGLRQSQMLGWGPTEDAAWDALSEGLAADFNRG
jgi:hypothetical protein